MPFGHFDVGSAWQSLFRENSREGTAVDGICNVETFDRCLKEGNMFFWLEKKLDGLPSHEPLRCQCWNCRWAEWILDGLERVVTA